MSALTFGRLGSRANELILELLLIWASSGADSRSRALAPPANSDPCCYARRARGRVLNSSEKLELHELLKAASPRRA